jgi:hypothetical protein
MPNGTACNDGDYCTIGDNCTSGICVGKNVCCLERNPPKKSLCGICVKDCGNEAYIVLDFFGLPSAARDRAQKLVSGAVGGGGRCLGTPVCCTPKDQSIFAYDGQRCIGLKNTTSTP